MESWQSGNAPDSKSGEPVLSGRAGSNPVLSFFNENRRSIKKRESFIFKDLRFFFCFEETHKNTQVPHRYHNRTKKGPRVCGSLISCVAKVP